MCLYIESAVDLYAVMKLLPELIEFYCVSFFGIFIII